MRWALRLSLAMAIGLTVANIAAEGQDDAAVAALVEKAGQYVQAYRQQFSALVCEEHQIQQVIKGDGTVRQRRELRSDVLLVKVGERTMTFRDTIDVDGKPVRNREERLQKLFLSGTRNPMRQAQAVAEESARHNIGFRRGLDGLMVPLTILSPRWASGFRFSPAGQGLTFQETRSPSLLRLNQSGTEKDMFLHGSFTLDAASGRVLAASLTADNPEFELTIDVSYREESAVAMLVPVDMTEHYRRAGKPKEDRLEVSSSYSAFRRFQVTTEERIEPASERP